VELTNSKIADFPPQLISIEANSVDAVPLFAKGHMFHTNDITEREAGVCDVMCDTHEKWTTIQALFKGAIDVQYEKDAIFSNTPPHERKPDVPIEQKPVVSIITVRASRHDIMFALEAADKLVRPYPPKS
jgi:hypothetical protein